MEVLVFFVRRVRRPWLPLVHVAGVPVRPQTPALVSTTADELGSRIGIVDAPFIDTNQSIRTKLSSESSACSAHKSLKCG